MRDSLKIVPTFDMHLILDNCKHWKYYRFTVLFFECNFWIKKWLLSIRSRQRIPTEYDPDQKIYDHYKNIRISIENIRSWIRIIKIDLSNHKYTILSVKALVKRSYTFHLRIVSFEFGNRVLSGISIPRH